MSDFQHEVGQLAAATFKPPGAVSAQFMMDRANVVRFIMGPFGSGKTNLLFFDALKCAFEMPKCNDGNRRFRVVYLRDTYANLWGTTIKSWWGWFDRDLGKWQGADGRKASHELRFDMPDGGILVFEAIFQAIQDADVESALRGMEYTMLVMGEADLMHSDVLPYAVGRVEQQRYPAKGTRPTAVPQGTNYYVSVTGDYNPPDVDNPLYELFEETKPAHHKLYKQPSGRSPQGENHDRISIEVYEKMAETNAHRPDWVKRMVDGKYGPSRQGKPVYQEYDDDVHCAQDPFEPIPGLPLYLGFDQGIRGPVMLVAQWTPTGQFRVIDEICPGRIGPSGFARMCKIHLQTAYPGYSHLEYERQIALAVGDQAGFFGGDKETGDLAMLETVMQILGIAIIPNESQNIEIRLDGIRQLLRLRIDGVKPAFLLSPRCKMLRKGFNSHYFYPTKQGRDHSEPVPKKNEYADPQDALQYIVQMLMGVDAIKQGILGSGGGEMTDEFMGHNGGPPMQPNTDFDVFEC